MHIVVKHTNTDSLAATTVLLRTAADATDTVIAEGATVVVVAPAARAARVAPVLLLLLDRHTHSLLPGIQARELFQHSQQRAARSVVEPGLLLLLAPCPSSKNKKNTPGWRDWPFNGFLRPPKGPKMVIFGQKPKISQKWWGIGPNDLGTKRNVFYML